ncbi:stage III sporulation protein AG [Abyssisolibacter fermentans]|uniref:stage III sporulation protein AG n=1 Tax=Abyssisolibacter fermentans TaxID=1766203 RepID=UPI000833457F|nr:stage III sporulation protein AG [Abyssisolibacter fermentans]
MSFKETINKFIGSNDKKANNLIFLLIIGILLLIGSTYFSDDSKKNEDLSDDQPVQSSSIFTNQNSKDIIDNYANNIENKLEDILSKIRGVGSVEVMVTLEDTAERIPAINTTTIIEKTDEKDYQGGTRATNKENEINEIVTKSSDEEGLVILKEIKPKVKGVIVVAQGVDNIKVKEDLYSAVKTVLGLSGNKVEVFLSD